MLFNPLLKHSACLPYIALPTSSMWNFTFNCFRRHLILHLVRSHFSVIAGWIAVLILTVSMVLQTLSIHILRYFSHNYGRHNHFSCVSSSGKELVTVLMFSIPFVSMRDDM